MAAASPCSPKNVSEVLKGTLLVIPKDWVRWIKIIHTGCFYLEGYAGIGESHYCFPAAAATRQFAQMVFTAPLVMTQSHHHLAISLLTNGQPDLVRNDPEKSKNAAASSVTAFLLRSQIPPHHQSWDCRVPEFTAVQVQRSPTNRNLAANFMNHYYLPDFHKTNMERACWPAWVFLAHCCTIFTIFPGRL